MDNVLFYGQGGDETRRQVRSAAAQYSHRIGPRRPKGSRPRARRGDGGEQQQSHQQQQQQQQQPVARRRKTAHKKSTSTSAHSDASSSQQTYNGNSSPLDASSSEHEARATVASVSSAGAERSTSSLSDRDADQCSAQRQAAEQQSKEESYGLRWYGRTSTAPPIPPSIPFERRSQGGGVPISPQSNAATPRSAQPVQNEALLCRKLPQYSWTEYPRYMTSTTISPPVQMPQPPGPEHKTMRPILPPLTTSVAPSSRGAEQFSAPRIVKRERVNERETMSRRPS